MMPLHRSPSDSRFKMRSFDSVRLHPSYHKLLDAVARRHVDDHSKDLESLIKEIREEGSPIQQITEEDVLLILNVLKDDRGYTCLHIAVEKSAVKNCEVLLRNGIDVNANNSSAETPLHIASEIGREKIVNLLLKHGSKVNATDSNGWTPLHRACFHDHYGIVEVLLGQPDIKVDMCAKGSDRWTPLHAAVMVGNKESVAALLKKTSTLSSKPDEKGDHPLLMAAYRGYDDICKLLLQKEADPRATDLHSGWNALHKAAYRKHLNVVKLLVDWDQKKHPLSDDPAVRYINIAAAQDDYTPLLCAVASKDAEVVEFLLGKGAKLDAREKRIGNTPLLMAAYNRAASVVDVLLTNGADVNEEDTRDGWTCLHKACYSAAKTSSDNDIATVETPSDAKLVKLFIDRGVAVNKEAWKDLWTPLHCAAAGGSAPVARVLLEAGAGLSLEKKEKHWEETPLMIAAFRGNDECINVLLDKSVSLLEGNASLATQLAAKDRDGWTALFKAAYSPRAFSSTVKLLLERDSDLKSSLTYAAKSGYTVLHAACAAKKTEVCLEEKVLEVLKLLVDAAERVGCLAFLLQAKEERTENTPLLLAAYNGYSHCVDFLIDREACINAVDVYGWSALHKAAYRGKQSVVKRLLLNGADLNKCADEVGQDHWRPLHCAARSKDVGTVELLLKMKAQIDVKTLEKRYTPLLIAAYNGDEPICAALLKHGADVNARDCQGWNALLKACFMGHAGVVRLLLEHVGHKPSQKVDVNAIARVPESNDSNPINAPQSGPSAGRVSAPPAEIASAPSAKGVGASLANNVSSSLEDITSAQASAPSDLNAQRGDSWRGRKKESARADGWTALHASCHKGVVSILELLLSKTADISIKDTLHGDTPLAIAVFQAHVPVVKMLLHRGADFKVKDTEDRNLMHKICMSPHADEGEDDDKTNGCQIVELLLQYGGDCFFEPDRNGWTPLHWCCNHRGNPQQLKRRVQQLKILLDDSRAREHLNRKTSNNKDQQRDFRLSTPLIIAAVTSNSEAFNLLKVYPQVDRIAVNEDGKSAFDYLKTYDYQLNFALDALDEGRSEHVLTELKEYDYHLWFQIIRLDDGVGNAARDLVIGTADNELRYNRLLDKVKLVLDNHPSLAAAKDAHERDVLDVASKKMKEILLNFRYWHGIYNTEPTPLHASGTCFVFKGVTTADLLKKAGASRVDVRRAHQYHHADAVGQQEPRQAAEGVQLDADGQQPVRVALKLVKTKSHFEREIKMRSSKTGGNRFKDAYVINILLKHEPIGSPDVVVDVEAKTDGKLSKAKAEKLFTLVMPLADRDLIAALYRETWAGCKVVDGLPVWQNKNEVKHVFQQLCDCVSHMHSEGVLHADLKPLNFVRTAGQWKLIDFDAACEMGEQVGYKSSSAYAPPEAFFIDESGNVRVKSAMDDDNSYEPLLADPSFDVWSLGCILFDMCTGRTLFQSGRDCNLAEADDLMVLATWSTEHKESKLSVVADPVARNLLWIMLEKDPRKRVALDRVQQHPFLSDRVVARMAGGKAKYDVFLSYRRNSEKPLVAELYRLLKNDHGLEVFLDDECMVDGKGWEDRFCAGLADSYAFVPLLSHDAIEHDTIACQNFSKLTAVSPCDNVFLEHRLAIELKGLGYIERIFPVFVAKKKDDGQYDNYGINKRKLSELPDVPVMELEKKLRDHMVKQALGHPLVPDRTVQSVLTEITKFHGRFVEFCEGDENKGLCDVAERIKKMVEGNDGGYDGKRRESQGGASPSAKGASSPSMTLASAAWTPATASATVSATEPPATPMAGSDQALHAELNALRGLKEAIAVAIRGDNLNVAMVKQALAASENISSPQASTASV